MTKISDKDRDDGPLESLYLTTKGALCPFCQSPDIEGGEIEINRSSPWQEVSCNQCFGRWNDLYTLSGIEVLDDPRPRRYQFQVSAGAGNNIDISFQNLDSFAGLNPEHSLLEIAGLKVGQSLPYSTGALVRLEDAGKDVDVVSGLNPWFDYTNQAWVIDGVYATCGHDKDRTCMNGNTGYQCFGRLHAGEKPAQAIVEQYANLQTQG